MSCAVLILHRSIGIISVPFMPPIRSLSNHMAGIVMMKVFSFMESLPPATILHTHTGMATFRRPTLSNRLDLLVAASFLRLLLKVLSIHGITGKIYTKCTMIYYAFCQKKFQGPYHFAQPKILSLAK